MNLSKAELRRYSRHIILPEFNIEGQQKLKESSVLVVGAGGLGCPILQYLTAAGVGRIGIADFDTVDESNLQRQVLFTEDDIGRSKVEVAIEKLTRSNPHITFDAFNTKITSKNALEIIEDYDIVCDGADNFPTRYLVNDACVILKKANIHGAIFRFEGQLSVFNMPLKEGSFGPNYRDLFPKPPPPGLVPNCAEGGVIGVLPGIIGSLQASEALKVLTGIGEPLSGKLFIFDTLTFESRILNISPNPSLKKIDKLIDYEIFCGVKMDQGNDIKEVTVFELKEMMSQNSDIQVVDVREPYEFEIANIGGDLIPMDHLHDRLDKISTSGKVIVHCRTGVRSAKAVKQLREAGFDHVYNLKGGILEWINQIDDKLTRY